MGVVALRGLATLQIAGVERRQLALVLAVLELRSCQGQLVRLDQGRL